jgi:hypothetical protein
MRVKLLSTMAHPLGGGQAGKVVDLPEELARQVLADGCAIEAPEAKPVTVQLSPEDFDRLQREGRITAKRVETAAANGTAAVPQLTQGAQATGAGARVVTGAAPGGYEVARVAERVGRSVSYVYDRLKLLSLTEMSAPEAAELADGIQTVEDIDEMQAAEQAGKKRVTVLRALEARREALAQAAGETA